MLVVPSIYKTRIQEFRDHVNQQLLEGTNPFNSSSTVEANSSLILINSSSTYEALDVSGQVDRR